MRAQGGPLFCSAAAVPAMVRSEGVSESLGDVLLQCSGGTPRATITGNLGLMLPVAITNRVGADGLSSGLTLAVNGVPLPVSGRVTGQNVTFSGVSFTIPESGPVALRIAGLRGNISAFGTAQIPVQAQISSTLNSVVLSNNPVTVGLPQRGLLATYSSTGIPCTGSPIPSSLSLSQLFSTGTRFASTRVTEGYAGAFQKREASADSGTRIVARYTQIPAGTRLFVPDAVAGSNSAQPTAGGDLGVPAAGGQYTPGSLLLLRVIGADATGAGGAPLQNPGAGTLNSVAELPISGSSTYVVYEVADSDPFTRESAQWPTFFGMPTIIATGTAMETLGFAPVAGEFTASVMAPIPRFASVPPPSDCATLGDCDSDVFPHLSVNSGSLLFTAVQGGAAMQPPGYLPVQNTGRGMMPWAATVAYTNGEGWLKLLPSSGINNGSVRVYVSPQALAAGAYRAAITIDAGDRAGKQAVAVTLTVSPAPSTPSDPPPVTPPAPKPAISWIHNTADPRMSTLAPGGQATLHGSNFNGSAVAVTFDGIAARILATADGSIDVLVPAELAGKTSAQAVVTVDTRAGDPQTVALAASAPGIFTGGVLNADGAVNGDAVPAVSGSALAILTTGLPADPQSVRVKLHDRENLAPLSVSAVPGRDGVQQVSVTIPGDLPTMPTEVVVCASQACSWPARVVLRAAGD